MKISKKLRNLALGGLIGLASLMPFKTKSETKESAILTNYNNTNEFYKPRLSENDTSLRDYDFGGTIPNLAKSAISWYLADALMVGVHEKGHYNEAIEQGLNPSMKLTPITLWVNGSYNYDGAPNSSEDEAKIDIAGFVNTGNLAEQLRNEINISKISKDGLRFKSMFALACELNLPIYLGMHYLGTASGGDDIHNFSNSSGVKPEQMLIGSGLHLLLNSPYLYELARNALGYQLNTKETKKIGISFRFDGDKYMLYVHADLDSLIEKVYKPDLSRFGSKL